MISYGFNLEWANLPRGLLITCSVWCKVGSFVEGEGIFKGTFIDFKDTYI